MAKSLSLDQTVVVILVIMITNFILTTTTAATTVITTTAAPCHNQSTVSSHKSQQSSKHIQPTKTLIASADDHPNIVQQTFLNFKTESNSKVLLFSSTFSSSSSFPSFSSSSSSPSSLPPSSLSPSLSYSPTSASISSLSSSFSNSSSSKIESSFPPAISSTSLESLSSISPSSVVSSFSTSISYPSSTISPSGTLKQELPKKITIFDSDDIENMIEDEDDDDKVRNDKSRTITVNNHSPETARSLNMSSLISVPVRRDYDLSQVQIATQHMFYIRNEWSCGQPKPKLVKVLDFHASPSKAYVPRCTVLHRCGDESGCCEDVTHRCEPAKSELIELYFHVIRSDIKNNITGGNAVGIEKLTFLNHTKCECRPINYQPRSLIKRPPMKLFVKNTTLIGAGSRLTRYEKEYHHHQKCRHVIKCAKPFMHRFREIDQRCICDCISASVMGGISADDHRKCVDIQLGNGRLDSYGQRCVHSGECTEPICGIGLSFSQEDGKCLPLKNNPRFLLQRLSSTSSSSSTAFQGYGSKSMPHHRHQHHRNSHHQQRQQAPRSLPHHHHNHSENHHQNNSHHRDIPKSVTDT